MPCEHLGLFIPTLWFYDMLKIAHLLIGVIALLLFVVFTLSGSLPWSAQTDALYLAMFGLMNLLIAPFLPNWHRGARGLFQRIACSLLLFAGALQGLTVVLKEPQLLGQPVVLFSLLAAFFGVLLHLMANLKLLKRRRAGSRTSTEREVGTVKWFNTTKGFGFISRSDGDDVFVHFRAIRGEGHRALQEGQRVEFSVTQHYKGLQAEDVIEVG